MLRWEKNLRKTQKYAKASRSQSCPVSIEQKNSGSNFFHNSAVTREILWRPRRSLISCTGCFLYPVNISKPSFFVFRGYRVGPVTINKLKELEMRAWPRKKKQSVADALWSCPWKICQIYWKTTVESHFKKVVGLQSASLLKRDSDRGVPCESSKIFRRSFLQNTPG